MPIPVPDGDSAVAILKWLAALLVAGISSLAGFIIWIITRFSSRETGVIREVVESVDNLAGVVETQDSGIEEVGKHLKRANQLEHDRQLLEADRQNRGS